MTKHVGTHSFIFWLVLVLVVGIIITSGFYQQVIIPKTVQEGMMIQAQIKEQVEKSIKVEQETKVKQKLQSAVRFLNNSVDPVIQDYILEVLITECKKRNIPPLLVLCLIKEESNFSITSTSKLGAKGLMQVMPKAHGDKINSYGMKSNELYYIQNNIALGVEILSEYFNNSNDVVDALQKYVGATTKDNVHQYMYNILGNYTTLQILHFN